VPDSISKAKRSSYKYILDNLVLIVQSVRNLASSPIPSIVGVSWSGEVPRLTAQLRS
jgi:hypothetical protein